MSDVETKLNEKFEISGYSPDFNSGILKVMATDLRINNGPELEYEIPFSEIANAYYPEGKGEIVNVVLYYNGVDKDSGPYTEPYDFPMRSASFVGEMLDTVRDTKLDKTDREQYLLIFDNVLAGILEAKQHATIG